MNETKLKDIIKKLPDGPGVYIFKRGKNILYIGKATSLRDRVRSYFNSDIETVRGPLIAKMLSEFDNISFEKTDSVLEALILEAHLIKKHQPPANTKEKDNKSFNYVIITREDFPRVLVKREKELKENVISYDISYKFGPFPNGGQLKEALKIIRKMFPFRDKCLPIQGRPCFNRQIRLCPGVCTGEISKKEYAKTIKNITLFFEGNKKRLVKNLEKEMTKLAQERKFEKAGEKKRQIFALSHIQDVSLIKEHPMQTEGSFRIESFDIAHLSGQNMVGVMTVVEDGEAKKSDYRKFKIRGNAGADDTRALAEVLTRRLAHTEWPYPDLVVVDGGIAQRKIMEKILREKNLQIPAVSVVKDEKHQPREILTEPGDKKLKTLYEREILLSNAEAHRFALGFHKQLRRNFKR